MYINYMSIINPWILKQVVCIVTTLFQMVKYSFWSNTAIIHPFLDEMFVIPRLFFYIIYICNHFPEHKEIRASLGEGIRLSCVILPPLERERFNPNVLCLVQGMSLLVGTVFCSATDVHFRHVCKVYMCHEKKSPEDF